MTRTIRILVISAAVLPASAMTAAAAAAALPEFAPGTEGEVFLGKSGKVVYQIKGNNTMNCKESTVVKGELLNAKAALVVRELSGCKFGGLPANSLGAEKERIILHLEAELCYVEESSKRVGIVSLLLPATIEVPATKLTILLEGSYVAEITPVETKTSTYTIISAQKEGKQTIEKCEGDSARTFLVSLDGEAAKQTALEVKEDSITFIKERTLKA